MLDAGDWPHSAARGALSPSGSTCPWPCSTPHSRTPNASAHGVPRSAATHVSSSARARAVFAPVRDLGVIIVDEERRLLQTTRRWLPIFRADLAVVRAQQAHVPIVLGSASAGSRIAPQRKHRSLRKAHAAPSSRAVGAPANRVSRLARKRCGRRHLDARHSGNRAALEG